MLQTRGLTPPARLNPRRGVVILAVLVVITILSLAAYQYSDLMTAEVKASDSALRAAQARLFAESGVHYAAALLSDPANLTNLLDGNVYNNAGMFQDQAVTGPDGVTKGRFSIMAAVDVEDFNAGNERYRYGFIDEGGKIPINGLIKLDKSGKALRDMLMKVPNMTEEAADSITDWVDADQQSRASGAEDDYYGGLETPYRARNGPIDNLDELLLVRGVTPLLLYGNDRNRNGWLDPEEEDGADFGVGWQQYLSAHGREGSLNSEGKQRISLGEKDLQKLYSTLSPEVGEELASFIILYRVYGVTTSLPKGAKSQSSAGGFGKSGAGGGGGGGKSGQLTAKVDIKSIYDLVNGYIAVTTGEGDKKVTTYFASPLMDEARQRELLPLLFEKTTTAKSTSKGTSTSTSTSTSKDVWGRVNVNSAPREVLLGIPNIKEADVDKIVSTRPPVASTTPPDEIFKTPAWLLTEAKLSIDTLKNLEKYVTTRSQVYRVQVIGYHEDGGPTARVEAVIDISSGRPRVLAMRPLTDLGSGFSSPNGTR